MTAAEFLNEADEAEIARVIKEYGEEPRARAVARAIVAARPLTRTAELAAVVRKALGLSPGTEERSRDPHLPGDPHPSERRARRAGAGAARRRARRFAPGGRLAVVTFHSLEDRIVKRFLQEPQRGDPRRLAPSPDGRQRARPELRTSRQAGLPVGARAGQQPARALGAAANRSPHRCARVGPGDGAGMSARSFRSVGLVGGDRWRGARLLSGLAARRLGTRRAGRCREPRSSLAQRDIRLLQTEIGTRGRLAQLERWNVKVIACRRRAPTSSSKAASSWPRWSSPRRKVDDRSAGGAGLGSGRATRPSRRRSSTTRTSARRGRTRACRQRHDARGELQALRSLQADRSPKRRPAERVDQPAPKPAKADDQACDEARQNRDGRPARALAGRQADGQGRASPTAHRRRATPKRTLKDTGPAQ